MLAAQGILPIAPSDLIPLQVELAQSDDELTADYARKSLDAVDSRFVAALLTTDASHEVLGYFAETSRDALVLEAVIRRRDTPRVLMVDLARRLPADLQEILLLRQDAIVECPDILRALEENPAASIYSKRRILEYREHLLPRERKARVETTAPVEAAAEELEVLLLVGEVAQVPGDHPELRLLVPVRRARVPAEAEERADLRTPECVGGDQEAEERAREGASAEPRGPATRATTAAAARAHDSNSYSLRPILRSCTGLSTPTKPLKRGSTSRKRSW